MQSDTVKDSDNIYYHGFKQVDLPAKITENTGTNN